jgi:creatinine amidohydrolase
MLHAWCPPARYLPHLSRADIARLPDKADTVIVLPVGCGERHAAHLSGAVDTVIAAGVVGHALARLPAGVAAYALEAVSCGFDDARPHRAGSIALDGSPLEATVAEIGESVYRAGFRKLLIVSGRGSPQPALVAAAAALGQRHADFAVLAQVACELNDADTETALVMALAPGAVHLEQLVLDAGAAAGGAPRAVAPDVASVLGIGVQATPEQGLALLDALATSWAEGIAELHRTHWIERDEQCWGETHLGEF